MKKVLLLAVSFFFFSAIIYAQAGELDSSFGTNGVVKTDIGFGNETPLVKTQVLAAADGSHYQPFRSHSENDTGE